MRALVGALTERSGFDSIMKFFAFPAAIGLTISLATVTPARNDKKDGRSSEKREKLERAMPVDPSATITVCVMSGAIEVRGTDKHEVRVRSADAGVLDFRRIDRIKVKEKERQPETPALRVDVMVMDKSDKTGAKGDCQAIANVELEVPKGATVQVQTRDGDINIVGVAAAYAGSQNGDIAIERASKLVEAGSVGGSISLRDSTGRINLSSAGGTVDAINIRGTSSEDTLEVGTVSGDVQLDRISNSKLIAKTVTGSVTMSGPLARSGQYGFNTLSGDVILELPADASFHIVATLSKNHNIISDFPLKYSEVAPASVPDPKSKPSPASAPKTPSPKTAPPAKTPPPAKAYPSTVKVVPLAPVVIRPSVSVVRQPLRRISAIYGAGDASISVNSFSGSVRLKKL
jgi:Putative adhesin